MDIKCVYFRWLMQCILLAALTIVICSSPVLGSMDDEGVQDVLKRLENKFEHINSIKVHFYQTILRKGQKEPFRARGTAWFKRPHSMRWEYEAPERQLIIVNGERVFLWEQGPNQVMVYKRKRFIPGELGNIFFPSASLIEKNFFVEREKSTADTILLELTPKGELSGVRKIHVRFHRSNMMISALEFEDSLGTKTVIRFEDAEVNPDTPEELFVFKPPEGAKIYYQD